MQIPNANLSSLDIRYDEMMNMNYMNMKSSYRGSLHVREIYTLTWLHCTPPHITLIRKTQIQESQKQQYFKTSHWLISTLHSTSTLRTKTYNSPQPPLRIKWYCPLGRVSLFRDLFWSGSFTNGVSHWSVNGNGWWKGKPTRLHVGSITIWSQHVNLPFHRTDTHLTHLSETT